MIPFTQSVQNRQFHRNRKQISGYQKGGEKGGVIVDGQRATFWGDENVVELVLMVAQFCEYTKNH